MGTSKLFADCFFRLDEETDVSRRDKAKLTALLIKHIPPVLCDIRVQEVSEGSSVELSITTLNSRNTTPSNNNNNTNNTLSPIKEESNDCSFEKDSHLFNSNQIFNTNQNSDAN